MAILACEDVVPEDEHEVVVKTLTTATWDGDIKTAREHRNQLCDVFGVKRPVVKVCV